MIKYVSKNDFRQAFEDMGKGESFTYEGLGVLYDWIEETMYNYELDVIELDSIWSEFENIDQFIEEMGNKYIETLEDLEEATRVIMLSDGEAFICRVDF